MFAYSDKSVRIWAPTQNDGVSSSSIVSLEDGTFAVITIASSIIFIDRLGEREDDDRQFAGCSWHPSDDHGMEVVPSCWFSFRAGSQVRTLHNAVRSTLRVTWNLTFYCFSQSGASVIKLC